MNPPVRMLVLWCPDWPAVAAAAVAGEPVGRPAAVFSANRVVACTAVARGYGVRRGMRRREAQSCCPELAVFGEDDGRDARLFESVARAVEELAVGVEVVRPGIVAVPVDGAAGYFGGEHGLLERLVDEVSVAAGVESQVGVADGLFAATLAARRSTLVEPGGTAEFLAPLPIRELDQPEAGRTELVTLLKQLGLRTLGAFAALEESDVSARFGTEGVLAHRLARGRSERPPSRRRPPPELSLAKAFDPPIDRVDAAAFVAKGLGERFHAGLAAHGLACTRLGIYATTETGEQLGRVWRCAEPLTPLGVADRVRWQFEGWLKAKDRPHSGIVRLRLEPEETVEGRSLQLGLWQAGASGVLRPSTEDEGVSGERAGRALVRVQGLLGPESVFTAVLDGGRDPAERVRLVPWGDRREKSAQAEANWAGRLPSPSPATVFVPPVPAQVLDENGHAVEITARRRVSAAPFLVSFEGGEPREVLAWAGPWFVGVRAGAGHARSGTRMRLQVLLADGADAEEAVLLRFEHHKNPMWTLEGKYD
ncbi:DNA polymerase Y family protein [Amycolatopsis sp. WAC 01376]|uniref:DNA polymerase Y family protein n=1 Tax=Amycolatopsis sp. WAC 01376 TaxID=2203195 RepID=UPI001F46484C|nr:DNA polymerase Y family protein [Amycolatopsis sp. WAC 01376]